MKNIEIKFVFPETGWQVKEEISNIVGWWVWGMVWEQVGQHILDQLRDEVGQ
jgi:hypothetical protein